MTSHIYTVQFNTGTEYGDGTDENVLIRLYGFNQKKAADFFCDYANEDDFEAKGYRYNYDLEVDEYIGEIEKVLVYVNPFTDKPQNAGWYLKSVDVKHTVDQKTYTQTFKCERWIGIPERCPERKDDVHRFVECYPEGSKQYDEDPEGKNAELKYPIRSVKRGATYPCYNDPYWNKDTKRPVYHSAGKIDPYCDEKYQ